MTRVRGVINALDGTISGSKRLFRAMTKHVDPSIIKKFDGLDLDYIRSLPTDHVDRLDANKLMAATKKISKTDRALAATESGFSAAIKTCGKNVGLCAGAGIAAYLVHESYKKLKKEKKQCLAICMPEDWDRYKEGLISQPTYKTKSAVSPYDPSLKYEALYPDNEDFICTKPNLLEDGFKLTDKDSCDKFCQNVCDFTLNDVLSNAPRQGVELGSGILKGVFGDIFDDMLSGSAVKTAMLVSSVLSCLLLLIVVFMILK